MLKAVTWCTFTTVSHYSLPSTSVWSAHMKTSQSDTSSKTNKRPAPHLKLRPERCSDYHHINTNSIKWSWGESPRLSWSPLDFRSPAEKMRNTEKSADLRCNSSFCVVPKANLHRSLCMFVCSLVFAYVACTQHVQCYIWGIKCDS